MENIFSHYYYFEESQIEENFLIMGRNYGYYEPLETPAKGVTPFVTTLSQKLLLNKNKSNEARIVNPFNMKMVGIAHYNNCQDTIVIIENPPAKAVEFFIAANNKEISTIIYELVKSKALDLHIEDMRKKAFSISERNKKV